MSDRRIRLAVVSPDRELRRRILAHADPFYFETFESESADAIPIPTRREAAPLVIVLADNARHPGAVRNVYAHDGTKVPTLFAQSEDEPANVDALVAIGIQDVISLHELTSIRLRDAALASLARERRLEELKRERNHAALKHEVAAAMARSTTDIEIVETLLDGLTSLGSQSATCWATRGDALVVMARRGAGGTSVPPADAVAEALRTGRRVRRSVDDGVCLCIPCAPRGRTEYVVEIDLDAAPGEGERAGLEQLVSYAGEALRRTRVHDDLRAERETMRRLVDALRRDVCDALDGPTADTRHAADAARRIALAMEMHARLVAGLTEVADTDLGALVERCAARGRVEARAVVTDVQATAAFAHVDPFALEQALDHLLAAGAGSACVRLTADDHAIYVDVEHPRGRARPEADDPGVHIAARIVDVHGGRLWEESIDGEGLRFCLQLRRDSKLVVREVSEAHADPSAVASPLDPELATIATAFRSERLRTFLELWNRARGERPLPHPSALEGAGWVGLRPDMAEARVVAGPDGEPTFSWTRIGPRLERRLRGTLAGNVASSDPAHLRALYERYRLCYRNARPLYDYARQRGGTSFGLERLLLPCSRTGGSEVTDILALALFD